MAETKRTDAYAALETAIEMLATANFDEGEVAVDAVLIVGVQHIHDDGGRGGSVYVFPRHGCQPAYITTGLLEMGQDFIRGRCRDLEDDD